MSNIMQFMNSQDESKIMNAMASKTSNNLPETKETITRKSGATEFYSVSQNMPTAGKHFKQQFNHENGTKHYQIVQEKLYESSDQEGKLAHFADVRDKVNSKTEEDKEEANQWEGIEQQHLDHLVRDHRTMSSVSEYSIKENMFFNETSKMQEERIRQKSPFGALKTWKLLKVMVKSNDDVRQEQFAMQLISQC